MKLLTYNQYNEYNSVNELYTNWNSIKYYIDKMWSEIKKLNTNKKLIKLTPYWHPGKDILSLPCDYLKSKYSQYTTIKFETNYNESYKKEIVKILDKYQKLLLKNLNIIFFYHIEKYLSEFLYTIYLKNLYTQRVKPLKYAYHCSSPKNRNSISQNGLIPKSSKESNEWNNNIVLYYPPAIFATKSGYWRNSDNVDVWEINTEDLPNKWWKDLNLYDFSNRHIMTFEPIPPEYLTLIKKSKK